MTAIFHITALENLASIISEDGLHCDAVTAARGLNEISIAHAHIKSIRERAIVPVPPGGTLADYVPFYFGPRSPMLGAIHTGQVHGYTGGQERILHLVSSIEVWTDAGHRPVFTDGHATVRMSRFYNDLEDLSHLDWKIMQERYWSDTDDDGDRMRRRQAEFLAHSFFPWTLISEIGVLNNSVAQEVNRLLRCQSGTHRPRIATRPQWYY